MAGYRTGVCDALDWLRLANTNTGDLTVSSSNMPFAKHYYTPAYSTSATVLISVCLSEQWLYKCIVHFSWHWYTTCTINMKQDRAISLQTYLPYKRVLVSLTLIYNLTKNYTAFKLICYIYSTALFVEAVWTLNNPFPSVLLYYSTFSFQWEASRMSINEWISSGHQYTETAKRQTDIHTTYLRHDKNISSTSIE